MKLIYDTQFGIEDYLSRGLQGLNDLATDRRNAYYERKEPLSSWIILGRWATDSCGNMSRCIISNDYGVKPITWLPDALPKVVEQEALFNVLKLHIASYSGWCVPPANVTCKECGELWTLENAHDLDVKDTHEMVNLSGFVGKTLREAEVPYKERTDGTFFFGSSDLGIRNDKFIDLTPDPKYPSCKTNERGWIRKITPDYIIQEGDETSTYAFYYRHKLCKQLASHRASLKDFQNIASKAGLKNIVLIPIQNEYHSNSTEAEPWWLLKTYKGTIKIGWRKSVINIDWSECKPVVDKLDYEQRQAVYDKFDANKIFPNENITKGTAYIHAHGEEKAVEYLSKIREVIGVKS